jgi:hypothetical protein
MRNFILIGVVSALITFAGGLRNSSASVEVNETIDNYKTLSAQTAELKQEIVLEQRLADVL